MATTEPAADPFVDPAECACITRVEDYAVHIGEAAVERILEKARLAHDLHAVHVNSTYYGGGVAELLSSLTLLMNAAGVETGWRALQGRPDYFSVTKKMHNALQGGEIRLTDLKTAIYEDVVAENALRTHFDHDVVIVHDPQPLPLIKHYRKRTPWVWHCHVDLTQPHGELWDYLRSFIEMYDAVVVSCPEYQQPLSRPQRIIHPAIDPFSTKNRDLSEAEIDERLDRYSIPTDLPIVTQVSRFDRWKDPEGVLDAFEIARREVDCTLVLLGNVATDDPEGQQVFESLLDRQEERIIILSQQDSALVNALQRRAAVVIQKSIREGFGLTVTEAMWKSAAVIGGDTTGIRQQISDGENGFLVRSVDDTADRIVRLLRDDDLRRAMGERARETVASRFLMSRLLEDYLDLLNAFRASFTLGDGGRRWH